VDAGQFEGLNEAFEGKGDMFFLGRDGRVYFFEDADKLRSIMIFYDPAELNRS
jgi:hypothetical protein